MGKKKKKKEILKEEEEKDSDTELWESGAYQDAEDEEGF